MQEEAKNIEEYTPEQIFEIQKAEERRQFEEFLHLDLQFHSRSNSFDKQLFYYDISIILLMLFCIKELLNYNFCKYQNLLTFIPSCIDINLLIFLPLFLIIFLCGFSSIALMRTLNLTMDAFEIQKNIIINNDPLQLKKLNDQHKDLKIKNRKYNKYAYWSFIFSCIVLFIHFIILTIILIFLKQYEFYI